MLELYNGSLKVEEIFKKWREFGKEKNFGAFVTFVGTVREENEIEALSFDVYEPMLKKWFSKWQKKANEQKAHIMMAHSIGDVKIHTSSFMAGIFSPKRKIALKLIEEFVEDFKKSAPIWKYDVIEGKRIFAEDRSKKIEGSGILL